MFQSFANVSIILIADVSNIASNLKKFIVHRAYIDYYTFLIFSISEYISDKK